MADRLLNRQASLLEYLTSGEAIFDRASRALPSPPLAGIDPRLLHLEARFSHEKRMQKIREVFPRTFALLGARRARIVEAFARSCPPVDISRLVNARQFFEFVAAAGRMPAVPHLRDVAACELALAQVRASSERPRTEESEQSEERGTSRRGHIRRSRNVVLLRCSHDIRCIFEEDAGAPSPAERDTPILIGALPGNEHPQVLELPPAVFDLLAGLDDWTDPTRFGASARLKPLLQELVEHGLVEVARCE
ncbi:MAG TPA: hypothetical protein VGF60_17245 [Xanthobacteraceae bacterium]